MKKCIRCNRSVIFGKVCRLCELEFKQKVKVIREVFLREFTKRDKLERVIEQNPATHEQLKELAKRLGA